MTLLRLFVDNLLPLLLAASAGYAVAATLKPDIRAFSSVAFNVFAPCLIFQVILESRVEMITLVRMMGFTTVGLLLLGAVAVAIARWRGWSRPLSSAVVLCVMLPNAANFGMSASLLAFGREGLMQASLYFITFSILTYTVGVLVASLGHASPKSALLGLVRVPTIWAVVIALVLRACGWSPPGPAMQAIDLLARACIPSFLVILGMQLYGVRLQGPALPLSVAGSLRLVGGFLAGWVLAPRFGLEGTAFQVGVFQSSMPTAVITTILATEYDVEPRFVASVVFLTTLVSPFTLTPALAILKG